MKWLNTGLAASALALACAAPVGAETLRLSGTNPAASDEAAALHSIAVDPFGGQDGQRLSFLIEGRLRDAHVGGQPWFTVMARQAADDADAVLEGVADPRLTESEFIGQRDTCIAHAPDGTCTQRGLVETRCLSVSASLRPALRLIANDGQILWSGEPSYAQDFSWCPEFDAAPAIDPVIDGWLDATAAYVRHALAPSNWVRDVRIMEGRGGLSRPARRAFRDAIHLTERDPYGACMAFTQLLAANPGHPSLMFNVGLCAEERGDFATAYSQYQAALPHGTSDDEGRAGLSRLHLRDRADRQLALHDATPRYLAQR